MTGEIPDIENVVYIDEYPHLAEKVRLRRLGKLSLVTDLSNILIFEPKEGTDGQQETLLPSS